MSQRFKINKTRRIAIIIFTVIILCITGILLFRNHETRPARGYIAHAGGAIDGYAYTNSLEAVQNAIDRGYKYIELDLAMTSDSVLVAVHDWMRFRRMCGLDTIDAPVSYDDFINQKILDKYHPLSATMIDSIFASHPELVLVTDKIDDVDILMHWFPNLKGRMMTECFNDVAYNDVKGAGITPMRSFVKFRNILGRGRTFVIDKSLYDVLKDTEIYKIETKLFNSRMNVFFVDRTVDKSTADSLMATDPYIDHVYVDIL